MNIRNIINDYVECNNFEIKIINSKIYVYFYDKIDFFSSNKIIIISNDMKYKFSGQNLVIEKMFKEELVISGIITNISFGDDYE